MDGRWRRAVGWVAASGWLAGVAACGHDVYHQVRPGDTLYRIGKTYGVSVEQLAEVNRLPDASRLEVGQRLLIPGAAHGSPVTLVPAPTPSLRALARSEVPSDAPIFAWPVVGGTVASPFGERGSSFHDGIDISAPAGTPVRAAQDGEVLYSAALNGYGNVIILRHTQGFATVYAHNQRNRVHEGQRVRRGDVIGSVGDSGHASGANLHFEVRQDNVARNPLYFLPAAEQVAAPPAPAGRGG